MILGSALEVLGIGLIFPILAIVSDPESSLHSMNWLQQIYDQLGFSSIKVFLLALCGVTFSIYLAKNLVTFLIAFAQNRFVWGQGAIQANRLLLGYLAAPYRFHLQHDGATLLRNVTQTLHEVFAVVLMPLLTIGTEILVVLAIFGLLMTIAPLVTLIACMVLGGIAIAFHLFVRRRIRDWGQRFQTANRERLQSASQAFTGVKEIKAHGHEKYFGAIFAAATNMWARSRLHIAVLNQLPRGLMEILTIGVILVTVSVILIRGLDLNSLLPTLGVFALAAVRVMPSINRITAQSNTVRFGGPAVEVVFEDIVELSKPRLYDGTTTPATPMNDSLTLKEVTFSYGDEEMPVLNGINLRIERGESIALVGASGAGKTTLADLILGLLDPTSGKILVDGNPIGNNLRAWQAGIGYIPQEVFILNDTLKRNIALGVNDDAIDDVALKKAIEYAHLEEVVALLPRGTDTVLGDRGIRLSGGQRQRVAIARALYHDPELLVFDEATSSLDTETEKEITRVIDDLAGHKTLIIIAHRLSTVRDCTRLVFLKDGRVADIGGFDELARRNTDFSRMVAAADLNSATV